MEHPKLKRDWKGLKVCSTRLLATHDYVFPIGTTFTVERNYAGLYLVSDPCPECGIQARVNKVSEWEVEILEQEDGN